MKVLLKATMAAILIVTAQAQAQLYNLTFSGGGYSASGQINVTGGIATSGYLDVTYGATTVDYNYLAIGPTTAVVQNNNGDNLPYGDNVINVGAPDFVDEYGLLFLTAPVVGWHTAGAGMYLSADQNHGYVPNLNGYGNSPGFGWGVPDTDGTVTLAPAAVPEASTLLGGVLLLLPLGVSMLRNLRKTRMP
jgi:hypothetical protein